MTAPASPPRLELTREALQAALATKLKASGATMWCSALGSSDAQQVADAIRLHNLTDVQSGLRHDGKGCTFARCFELIYGERLTLR